MASADNNEQIIAGCPGTNYVGTYVRNKYSQSCKPSFFRGLKCQNFGIWLCPQGDKQTSC